MVDLGPTRVYVPRPGDIGLTQITGWGGRGIRLAQWANGDGYADYEHAFGVESVRPTDDVRMIVEAMPGGARHVPDWHTPARTRWLVCPDEHREAVAQAYLDAVGTPYSWADYASLALHRFHLPAPHLRRYVASSGHMICSQLVDHCAALGGWHLFDDGRWPGDVTPGDLNRLWTQLPAGARA